MKTIFIGIFLWSMVLKGLCQDSQPPIPSVVELPIQPTRSISFTTDEGSYMNIDVSPDGKTLVFDLLGDLYTVPALGGKATQLTRGIALNLRPVWSPDGNRIAYISDISGSLHLNIRDIAGNYHRVLGREDEPLHDIQLASPLWLPSGQYIYMENIKMGGVDRSKIYGLIGGNLIAAPKLNRPFSFSSNGNIGYYIEADTIFRFDHQTRTRKKWTLVPKNKTSMALSPDGQWLAYIMDADTGKCLMIHNVLKNREQVLISELSIHPYDYKPGIPPQHFSFSPDSRYIYISYQGKIHRVDIETKEDVIIRFEADVKVDMGPLNYNTYGVRYDSIRVRYIRSINSRPDGKQLVFSALNKIYVMELPGGTPRPLAEQPFNQFQPVYSPDGRWIAYVTWSDTDGGFLWKIPANGGKPQKLSEESGLYYGPTWSPDGKELAIVMGIPKLGDRDILGKGKIRIFPINKGPVRTLDEEVDINNKLSFFLTERKELAYQPLFNTGGMLVSKDLKTDSVRALLLGGVGSFLEQHMMQAKSISPDGRFIVYSASEDLYLIPRDQLDGPQRIYDQNKTLSAVRFADGVDPYWENGGKVLCWTYGNRFFRIAPDKIIEAAEHKIQFEDSCGISGSGGPSVIVEPDESIEINLVAPASYAHGTIALINARILTMKGDEVIENGYLIIQDGRIKAIGPMKDAKIPQKIKVLDLNGTTIIPGLVDLHLHMKVPSGITAQQNWMFLASLAYGITTASDPSQMYGTFGYSELLRTGKMIGPRLFGAGQAVRSDVFIRMNNLDDARSLVRKRTAMGGILVKQYELLTRLQRQWLGIACREGRINMTNEGGINPILHIAMIKDGSTGIEHNTMLGEVYKDVVMLRAKCGTYWDPTLQVYPGFRFQAQDYMNWKYWRNHIDEKMSYYLPIDELKKVEQASPLDSIDPGFVTPSKIDARVRHEGGKVVLGSHGNDKGIGAHNEIWALHAGGLTNLEALQAATILGAQALGIQQDLGSLEVGKIADLIVLDKNPLKDIHNSRYIRYVMKDGILYNTDSLNEIWPQKKKLPDWKFNGKIE